MAGRKVGTVVYTHDLSPILTIFRLMPEPGGALAPSEAWSTASRVNIKFEMEEW